jgi:hypothetical protein
LFASRPPEVTAKDEALTRAENGAGARQLAKAFAAAAVAGPRFAASAQKAIRKDNVA